MAGKEPFAIEPKDVLSRLAEIPFDAGKVDADDPLRRAELLHSVLAIAGIDHVSASALVRQVVKNALGKLYEPEE